jgi:hypothetical protein
MSSSTRAGTTRKVLGSLAVIGTAAAVAGLGTFGTFTDSTTPVSAQLTSGTVSIDLAQPAAPIPAVTTGLLPGDSIARTLTLVNDGNSPLSSVALGVSTTNPSVLTTDPVNGLQLTLKACSVAWTQGATTAHLRLRGHRARPHPRRRRHRQPHPGGPRQPHPRRHRPPAAHPEPAGHRRQHLPGQDQHPGPHLLRRPARRHHPLTPATTNRRPS